MDSIRPLLWNETITIDPSCRGAWRNKDATAETDPQIHKVGIRITLPSVLGPPEHHVGEFLVVNLAVAVYVGLMDDGIHCPTRRLRQPRQHQKSRPT